MCWEHETHHRPVGSLPPICDKTNNCGFADDDDVMNDQARERAANERGGRVAFFETGTGADLARQYEPIGLPQGSPQLAGRGDCAAAVRYSERWASATPQVVTRDLAAAAQADPQLKQMLRDLPVMINAAMKGTIKLEPPPGVRADVSGAPDVSVPQSGGF